MSGQVRYPREAWRWQLGCCNDCDRVFGSDSRLSPQTQGYFECVQPLSFPPCPFIAHAMNFAMMCATQWHGELIADLAAQGLWLGEAQVMRVAGAPSANETRLAGDKFAVLRITQPYRLCRNRTPRQSWLL